MRTPRARRAPAKTRRRIPVSVEGGVQEAAEEGGSHFVSELFRRAGECPHV